MSDDELNQDLYSLPVTTINGEITTLTPYQGQVLLLVNVASRCGFTAQYAELETLYREYKHRGFTVLGFPCNQFLHQEPGSNDEINYFAQSCFHVSFPMFGKIEVRGSNRAPLYSYLASHIAKKPWVFIVWNFTKVLVNSQGQVLKRYLPFTSFKTIRKDIEALLPRKE